MRARVAPWNGVRAVVLGGFALAVAGGCRSGCERQPMQATCVPSGSSASASASANCDQHAFKHLAAKPDPPRPIGSETARGRHFPVAVTVSDTNITLEPTVQLMRKFSYESWAEWTFRKELADAGDAEAGRDCAREIKVRPVSWLMPLLGLREEIYQTCPREAHPGGETRFSTLWIDLNEHSLGSPRPVVLTELYDAPVIAEALRRDALVQKALKGREVPVELAELVRALAETPPVLEGKRCYSFPEDLLSRFVLHHGEGNESIAVRLGLPGAGPCRYELTELGLVLPVPKVLKAGYDYMRREPDFSYGSYFEADNREPSQTAVVHVTGGK